MYIFDSTVDIDTVPLRLCDTLQALYEMLSRALLGLVALAASVNVFNYGTVAQNGVQAQYLLGLGTYTILVHDCCHITYKLASQELGTLLGMLLEKLH